MLCLTVRAANAMDNLLLMFMSYIFVGTCPTDSQSKFSRLRTESREHLPDWLTSRGKTMLSARAIVITVVLFSALNCNRYHEIITTPSSEWSIEDCRLIIATTMAHNIQSGHRILVMATPFSPLVLTALCREDQMKRHLSMDSYHDDLDQLAAKSAGLFLDYDKEAFIDRKGRYYTGGLLQLDSLLLFVTLKDRMDPTDLPFVIGGGPAAEALRRQFDYLRSRMFAFDISDLSARIHLENDRHERIDPRFVWGRRRSILVRQENLFVMFPLRVNGEHFLAGSKKFYLIITGFGDDIRVEFTVAEVQ